MSYRPSGDVEAVLAEILAGESDGGPDFAAPLAETFGSVAEHRRRLAAAQLRERAASERDDPAAVEHSDPYGWTNDGIGCGRCHTYRMQCERSDCPGASRWGGDDPAAMEHEPGEIVLFPSDWIDCLDGSRWYVPNRAGRVVFDRVPPSREWCEHEAKRQAWLTRWQHRDA